MGRVPAGEGADGRVPTGCPVDGMPVDGVPIDGGAHDGDTRRRDAHARSSARRAATPSGRRRAVPPQPKQRRPPPSDSPPSSSTRTPARHPRRARRDRERRTLYSLDAPTTTRGTNVENPAIDPFDSARRISPRAPYFAPCSGTESTRRCSSSRVAPNRRPIPPTGGDGSADVPLGNRALAEADATATAARRAVVATARGGGRRREGGEAPLYGRAHRRGAAAGGAMTSAGLLRTDRGEDPRGDVGKKRRCARLVESSRRSLVRARGRASSVRRRRGRRRRRRRRGSEPLRARGGVSRPPRPRDAGGGKARALAADRARLQPLSTRNAAHCGPCLAANPAAVAEAAEKEAREGASKKASARRRSGRDGGPCDDEGERGRDAGGTRRARARGTREGGGGGASPGARERIRQTRAMGAIRGGPSAYDEADEGGSNANGDGERVEQSRQRGRRPDAGHATREFSGKGAGGAGTAPELYGVSLRARRRRAAAAESRLAADAFLGDAAAATSRCLERVVERTPAESAHAASKEEAWLCRLRASLLETRTDVDEALARAGVDPRDADVDPREAEPLAANVEKVAGTTAPGRSRHPDRQRPPSLESAPSLPSRTRLKCLPRRLPEASSPKASPPRNRWAAAFHRGARARPPAKKTTPRETTSDGGRVRLGGRRCTSPRTRRAREDGPTKTMTPKASKETSTHASKESTELNAVANDQHGSFSGDAGDVSGRRVRPVDRLRLGRLGRSVDSSSHGASRRRRTPHRAFSRGRGEIPGPTGLVARRVPSGETGTAPSRSSGRRIARARPRPPGATRRSNRRWRVEKFAFARRTSAFAREPARSRRRRRGGGRPDTRRGNAAAAILPEPPPYRRSRTSTVPRTPTTSTVPRSDENARVCRAWDSRTIPRTRTRGEPSNARRVRSRHVGDAPRETVRWRWTRTNSSPSVAASARDASTTRYALRVAARCSLGGRRRRRRRRPPRDTGLSRGRRRSAASASEPRVSPGEWARKEREYHDRLAVETPAMPSRIARDVESGAHARLLANANADASEETSGSRRGADAVADFDPARPRRQSRLFSIARGGGGGGGGGARSSRARARPSASSPDAHLLAERAGSSADSDSERRRDDAASALVQHPTFPADASRPGRSAGHPRIGSAHADARTVPGGTRAGAVPRANGVLRRSTSVPETLFRVRERDGERLRAASSASGFLRRSRRRERRRPRRFGFWNWRL